MDALFITFEGVEGAGKTTLARWLSERLRQEGIPNWLTYEPWEPRLREVLLEHGDLRREEELLLFLADRAIHTRHIRMALAEGKTVICDRYADSTLVYQGYARGLDVEWVRQMNGFATGGLQPVRTYLLDLPVQVGLQRQRERNRIGAEEIAFHEQVRVGFLAEAQREPQRYLVLDAMRPLADLQNLIWADISALRSSGVSVHPQNEARVGASSGKSAD
ncbi:MAG: dTMP kinase [Firmicutes bacterium]|nr:dTMP kinase [Bacillota bacterium]